MRFVCLFVLLLVTACADAADTPPSSQTAAAGVVKQGEVIALEAVNGAHRASGLWTETYTLPDRTKIKVVRLNDVTLPQGGKCDLITQVRWAGADGKWSAWTPENLLANGGFDLGAPRGVRRHVREVGGKAERSASAPAEPRGSAVLFWSSPALPGADVTFASDTGADAFGGWDGVGARLLDRSGRLVVQVLATVSRGDDAAFRRMAVGLSVSADAARIEGLCLLGAAKPGKTAPRIRARNGVVVFAPERAAGTVLLQDRFADAKSWNVVRATKSEWKKGASPALVLMAGPMHNPANAVRTEMTVFRHQGWLEVGATVTLSNAEAAVSLLLSDAQGKPLPERLSLRCQGADGTYRIRACGPVPKEAAQFRPVVQVLFAAGQAGSAAFHSVKVRSVPPPPAFTPRPPVDRIVLPKPTAAKYLEIRSFLLSADPKLTPSFTGYELDVE